MESKEKIKFSIIAIIAIAIFCFALAPVTLQNDTYYTIKIGEYILDNGITMVDPFSWHDGLIYTFPHWAYDVFTYLIFSLGGQWGIYILTAILSCILGITMYIVNSKITKNQLTSFLLTLGTMYLLRDYIAARAQLVTFILFILTIFCIEKFIETKKKRYAISLIIIPIIIANVHCAVWPFYFVLFLPYIGEYILALLSNTNVFAQKLKIKYFEKQFAKETDEEKRQAIQVLIDDYKEKLEKTKIKKEVLKSKSYKINIKKDDNVKWLIVIMLICTLTGFLTPIGDTPYTYLPKTMEGNTTKNINEHLPLTLADNKEFVCIIVIYLAILMFTDTKIRLRDLFMIGGLLFLSFETRRQVSMFLLIGVLMLNRLICDVFDKYDKEGSAKIIKAMLTIYGKIITLALVIIASVAIIKPKLSEKFVNEKSYPVQASEYILNNIDIHNMKLYNEYNYGSYLLFKGIPVFIDSRADLYAPEFNKGVDAFSDFLNISNIGTYYETKFEEYGITHVIVYKNAKLNMFLSRDDNYEELYKDDYFCIYKRLTQNVDKLDSK